MRICFTCIDVSEAICLLPDYLDSPGSSSELGYATAKGKEILFYEALTHDPVAEKV
jgi:nucleoside 2-deoxyribosyltransferase